MACIKCGRDKKIMARQMCSTCYKKAYRNKEFNTCCKNKITIKGDYAEMEIYDRQHNVKAIVLIDKNDVEKVSKHHWNMNGGGYIMSNVGRLHHFVLGFEWDGDQQNTVDHINRNKCDNRKSNLRIVDMTVQNRNRSIKPKVAKFITKNECGHYKVIIYTKNKESIYLGTFKTLDKAISIRDNFLKENDNLCYQLQE